MMTRELAMPHTRQSAMKPEVRLAVRDLTDIPGARFISDGDFSGEWFYESHLKAAFKDALEQDATLVVDLDGTFGYATSFLEQAFGELAIAFGADAVLKRLTIVSEEEPGLVDEVNQYIIDAPKSVKRRR